ncbi:phospho-sugar mutase [Brevibacillus choshinensis]|uniref:Phosphoglucomutase n=1 Tax=Brevibacillus choshinensis TaxID=54911 RepID=A0ABX7FUR1_BRECH|nr:phospho-sugar mutase [Brevibacillus choshinensis]QRG69342.1 phospho-sugar mutase [Brevibacillus choshinensis]
MNDWKTAFARWLGCPDLDEELRQQLDSLLLDEKALEDHFYKTIEFGTGGMRGELGPGTNRMNLYTVRKATEGLALYVSEHGDSAKQRGVAIAYDSRHKSPEFARETAAVLGRHGIRVYLFDRLMPTPLLSYAVRRLGAFSGIVITASHNPPAYNGYKVYGSDGGQITPQSAEKLLACIQSAGDELLIPSADFQSLQMQGTIQLIGDDVLRTYLDEVQKLRIHQDLSKDAKDNVRIVFTPLHGTTGESISRGLETFGYSQVTLVPEQALPDPDFSTVSSPNPEETAAFALAIHYATQHDADVIIGTDPDGDRLGVVAKNSQNEYVALTGNQVGALLLDDLLSQKQQKGTLPPNGIVMKTIVTSELGREIASHYGIATEDTLTGFKYIGEKMTDYEQTGEYVFQFGYEESFGFLIGDFVRDKDAVQTALLLADLCAYHKQCGRSLLDALESIWTRYGYYQESLYSVTLRGKDGMEKMASILCELRSHPIRQLPSGTILAIEDYLQQTRSDVGSQALTPLKLPSSDAIKYILDDASWFCVRPSGTEPKIKIYFGVKGDSPRDSERKLSLLTESVLRHLDLS